MPPGFICPFVLLLVMLVAQDYITNYRQDKTTNEGYNSHSRQ